jgi:uncharacterized protein
MKISELIWLQPIVDKLETKHNLRPEEVEEVFSNRPEFRFIENGNIAGEDVYTPTDGQPPVVMSPRSSS